MADLIKALKMVKNAYKPKPNKPKLTPEQFQKKSKVASSVNKVLNGVEPIDGLAKETTKLLAQLAKTFVQEAAEKANQMNAVLPSKRADFDESGQSDDREE